MIGVSEKNSTLISCEIKGPKQRPDKSPDSPLYHRTPAFLWQPGEQWGNVNFAVWYIRIRDIKKSESPYAGVIKVEKMLPSTGHEAEYGLSTGLKSNTASSAHLINERNPVCYGTDARWANHLYPVYMGRSTYCRSRFHSDYYFLNLFWFRHMVVGKIIATEKQPSTIEDFTFWTKKDLKLKPFDVVVVDHVNDSKTFGVVEQISTYD